MTESDRYAECATALACSDLRIHPSDRVRAAISIAFSFRGSAVNVATRLRDLGLQTP